MTRLGTICILIQDGFNYLFKNKINCFLRVPWCVAATCSEKGGVYINCDSGICNKTIIKDLIYYSAQ